MTDYRIKISVRNARLLRAIEATGHRSVKSWAEAEGLSYNAVSALVGLREAPIAEHGSFSPTATAVMEALCALPQELWTPEQLNAKLPRNTYEADVNEDEFKQSLTQMAATKLVGELTKNINDKRALSAAIMHASDEKTYAEIGAGFGVCGVRAGQLVHKGLRSMRDRARELGLDPGRWVLDEELEP